MLSLLSIEDSQSDSASLKIINPDLNLKENKIASENAAMPDLIFRLDPGELHLPPDTKYKWWVRVTYQTQPLQVSPALRTVGCNTGEKGYAAVWGLPGGTAKELCVADMSSRNTWIITDKPVLDLSQELKIQEKDGTIISLHLKDKSGNPAMHAGTILYGGGHIEVVVEVEYQKTDGSMESHQARFQSKGEQKIRGVNPDDFAIRNELNKIATALYTKNPDDAQMRLRKEIAGKNQFVPISETLRDVLVPLFDEIACLETQKTQFCGDKFCIGIERLPGMPIVSDDGGYGMFQLTNPPPTYPQKWSWTQELIHSVKRLYPYFATAKTLADSTSDLDEKKRYYFRELIARHNASGVGYYQPEGNRRPIMCREKVAFQHHAPLTDPLYSMSLKNNHSLLQALEYFGFTIKLENVECDSGKGRDIVYQIKNKKIKIYSVSTCRQGPHEINQLNMPVEKNWVIPNEIKVALDQFGNDLIDDKKAACDYDGFNKNAARNIQGKFIEPNIYLIEKVGRCHNSANCYVDVDIVSKAGSAGSCISPQSRRSY